MLLQRVCAVRSIAACRGRRSLPTTAAAAPTAQHQASRRQLLVCRPASMAATHQHIPLEQLRGQSCSLLGGCSSETPPLSASDAQQYLTQLTAWSLGPDGASIHRRFTARNFAAAIEFFNAVRIVADDENHHPDLHLTNYRDVEVVLSTHAIRGLSLLDILMATKIDALPVAYSPKWEREHKAQLEAAAAAQGSS